MLSLCIIPNLAKMPTVDLIKCIVLVIAIDVFIVLGCINL